MSTKRRRARNTGSVYLRGDSRLYWLRYKNLDGTIVQESSGTTNEQAALAMLRKKVARVENGQHVTPKAERAKLVEIVEASLLHDENQGLKNVKHDRGVWSSQMKPFFGLIPALAASMLDGSRIEAYQQMKRAAGADNDTINNHVAILRKAYNYASQRLGGQKPDFRKLWLPTTADPERLKAITDEQYTKLCAEAGAVGLWCRTLVELACNFGWRRNVWLNLKAAQVDMLNCRITLPGMLSKNGEPYTACFIKRDAIYPLLTACLAGKTPEDYVLTRETKKGRQPIKSFRGTWLRITKGAGIAMKPAKKGKAAAAGKLTRPGIVFHNTRNTAATRMIEADIPQAEAMDIGGWKTPAIFEHYHITSEKRKREAAEKMAARAALAAAEADKLRIKLRCNENGATSEAALNNGVPLTSRPS